MSEDKTQKIRFLFDESIAGSLSDERYNAKFIYRPDQSKSAPPIAIDATPGFKFAQRRVILDEWWLLGGTRWSRCWFRLKHPIVYSKRGLNNIYRRIKSFFFKEKSVIMLREWKSKHELLKIYPDNNEEV